MLLLTYHHDLLDPRIRAVLPIAPPFACAFRPKFFAALRELANDPLLGEVYRLGNDAYYRVVDGYLAFFDLVSDQHVVNVTAIERPH